MDSELLDTLNHIAKVRPDLCETDGRNFTLQLPDGSQALQIDTGIDGDKEDGDGNSDMAIVTGWAFQILTRSLAPFETPIEIAREKDDGMDIFQVTCWNRGVGRTGESEIFEYAIFDCIKQCLEPNAFSLEAW